MKSFWQLSWLNRWTRQVPSSAQQLKFNCSLFSVYRVPSNMEITIKKMSQLEDKNQAVMVADLSPSVALQLRFNFSVELLLRLWHRCRLNRLRVCDGFRFWLWGKRLGRQPTLHLPHALGSWYMRSHEHFIQLVRPDLNTQGLFLKKERSRQFITLAVFT